MHTSTVAEVLAEYESSPVDYPQPVSYDAIILAVAHQCFIDLGAKQIHDFGTPEHILYDINSVLPKDAVDARL
ncbi:MAG: hypothetical protein AB8B63_11525 [Granulosicoccus sp.]